VKNVFQLFLYDVMLIKPTDWSFSPITERTAPPVIWLSRGKSTVMLEHMPAQVSTMQARSLTSEI